MFILKNHLLKKNYRKSFLIFIVPKIILCWAPVFNHYFLEELTKALITIWYENRIDNINLIQQCLPTYSRDWKDSSPSVHDHSEVFIPCRRLWGYLERCWCLVNIGKMKNLGPGIKARQDKHTYHKKAKVGKATLLSFGYLYVCAISDRYCLLRMSSQNCPDACLLGLDIIKLKDYPS